MWTTSIFQWAGEGGAVSARFTLYSLHLGWSLACCQFVINRLSPLVASLLPLVFPSHLLFQNVKLVMSDPY